MIAAGGTLGIMIPPSTVFAVYGLITEQDVGKLFVAGVLPGILAVLMYMVTITVIGAVTPGLSAGRPAQHLGGAASSACATCGPRVLLFAFVIGGIYGGMFTATEAAGMGAGGAFILGVRARPAVPRRYPALAAGGDAHHRGGVHRPDRRAAVRLFPDRHPDAAEGHRVPDRSGHRPLRHPRR